MRPCFIDRVTDELEALLRAAQVEQRLCAPLARYGTLVLAANRAFNLTGAKDAAHLAPHILDSLTVAPLVRGTLVDVGSGAGLPGLPLAMATGVAVTLVESNRKKADFLQRALRELNLAAVVVAERAEVAARRLDLRERFDCGTARAVSNACVVAELLLPFVTLGGIAVFQRGTLDELERSALADAALVLGANIVEERPIGGERRIVIARKSRPTPPRFPRRTGIPEKRPLCT